MSRTHLIKALLLASAFPLYAVACSDSYWESVELDRAHYADPTFEYVWDHAEGTTHDITSRTPHIATGQTIRLAIRDEQGRVMSPTSVRVEAEQEEIISASISSQGYIEVEALAAGSATLLAEQYGDPDSIETIPIWVSDAASISVAPDELLFFELAIAEDTELAYMTGSQIQMDIRWMNEAGSPLLGEEFPWRGQEPKRSPWINKYEVQLPSSAQTWSLDLIDDERVESKPMIVADASTFDTLTVATRLREDSFFESEALNTMYTEERMALGIVVSSKEHTLQDYDPDLLEVVSTRPEVCEAGMVRSRYEHTTKNTSLAQYHAFFPEHLLTYLRIEALAEGECEVTITAPSLLEAQPLTIKTMVIPDAPQEEETQDPQEGTEEGGESPAGD